MKNQYYKPVLEISFYKDNVLTASNGDEFEFDIFEE